MVELLVKVSFKVGFNWKEKENLNYEEEVIPTAPAFNYGKVNIVTINDSFIDLNYIVYMFQYNSTHGKFHGTVKAVNRKCVTNGNTITIFQEQDPTKIKWVDAGIDYAVESSSIFSILEMAGTHLEWGAKRIIISSLSANAPMFLVGINHEK
ncbi:glyceraldehyde-3-phosphate dehydrogenase-like [Macaca thibetana thibetana]|uniref:glyceraldehyde-3-phosphate dehydrogenase-like n=1 Tax=Macaca thibetana thibetana TaxID=257877 RepID=UPI0021BC5E20|nr:glyceraldehyde-3-phosphate dehydrogenase-like [Macaca thibetana thibetana]